MTDEYEVFRRTEQLCGQTYDEVIAASVDTTYLDVANATSGTHSLFAQISEAVYAQVDGSVSLRET